MQIAFRSPWLSRVRRMFHHGGRDQTGGDLFRATPDRAAQHRRSRQRAPGIPVRQVETTTRKRFTYRNSCIVIL